MLVKPKSEQALRWRLRALENAHNPLHPKVLEAYEELVNLIEGQGRYSDADTFRRQIFDQIEKIYGEGSVESTAGLWLYVNYCFRHTLYRKAEGYCNQALSILGFEHPYSIEFQDSLAEIYDLSGRHDEAEALYKRLLAMNEKELGPDHPFLIDWLNQVATFYGTKGRYDEAQPYLLRSLEIIQNDPSQMLPSVSAAMFNLANLYSCWRKYREAEFYIKRALRMRHSMTGSDSCLRELATIYAKQGRYREAECVLNQCLTQNQLFIFHLECMVWMTAVYELQGKSRRAERMSNKVVAIVKNDHCAIFPSHLHALTDVADLYTVRERYDKAEAVYRLVLEVHNEEYKGCPYEIVESLDDLARFYQFQERDTEAQPLLERKREIWQYCFGSEYHPQKQGSNHISYPRPRFECEWVMVRKCDPSSGYFRSAPS